MREIKFRVWLKELEIWEHDFLPSSGEPFSEILAEKDFVFCQYTGLKDKNGKEIYEGDILDFDEAEWRGEFTPEAITMDDMKGEWLLCGSVGDVSQWRKVIGNIYQNPELLEES